MRNMSFMLTTQQIRDRTKTVTRRTGWAFLKPGDRVQAVEKGMGLAKGETVKRLAVLKVVAVKRVILGDLHQNECAREGFPSLHPSEFVAMFCQTHKGCTPQSAVTRIEFEYVEPDAGGTL